ncbi:MAG: hypothetical protein IH600_00755 [Bacteroidetes bacterium]|nr:hypothetical protein [Bacteroidota bacterium]
MDNTEFMRKGIAALEKHISLRQISLQSGINYITLRKIKIGETKNVSSGVAARFDAFQKQFDPTSVKSTGKKPGPKPKAAAAAPAAPAKKKPGPKPKAAAAAAPAAPAKKKPGRPKKVAAAPKPVVEQVANFGTPFLGDALAREIEIAEARIEYLKSLQMVEEEFLKAIGKK